MGWANSPEAKRMKSGGVMDDQSMVMPCMSNPYNGGIIGCPHCDEFNKINEEQGFDEAKNHKAIEVIVGITKILSGPKKNKFAMMRLPKKVAGTIIDGVTEKNPDLRWTYPDDINKGFVLAISKKKDGNYPKYTVQQSRKTHPVTQKYVEQVAAKIGEVIGVSSFDITNPIHRIRAFFALAKYDRYYSYRTDLKLDEVVSFKLLPAVTTTPNALPFYTIYAHTVNMYGGNQIAPTQWDKLWAEHNYDPAKGPVVQQAWKEYKKSVYGDVNANAYDDEPAPDDMDDDLDIGNMSAPGQPSAKDDDDDVLGPAFPSEASGMDDVPF